MLALERKDELAMWEYLMAADYGKQ